VPDFNISVDQISEMMGDKDNEFVECIRIVQDIIDNPSDYVGYQAMLYANKLAAFRTMMIIKSQMYKRRSQIMTEQDKFVNDIWKTMYEALAENINVLKITARNGQS
jgi:hypothetical protein